jgi:hypothetical protein
MRVGTVTFAQLAAPLIVLSLWFPISSQAATFWEESFENHLTPNWDTGACENMGITPAPQDGCNPKISTDVAHSGTHSLKGTYTVSGGQNGTFYDRAHTPTTEVWTRFYYYTVGFTYFSNETKHFFHKADNSVRDFLVDNWYSSRELSWGSESQLPGPPPCKSGGVSCNYLRNMASVPLNDNQWYCVESHVKENTLGQANGMLELWINGAQTVGYYGREFSDNPIPQFATLRIYVQNGSGLMYYDDFAVGDTRIGCGPGQTQAGGIGAPDVAPPRAPSGLRLQ